MKQHPSRGVLRRMIDEPEAVSGEQRTHAASCPTCTRRTAELAAAATSVMAAVGGPGANPAHIDPLPALRQLRATEPTTVPSKPTAVERLRDRFAERRRWVRAGAITTVVGLTMGTLVATGVASSLIQIFQPDNFAPVSINLMDLTSLPDLSGFGSVSEVKAPQVTETSSVAEAAAFSGLHLLTPTLPSSVKGSPTYLAATAMEGALTFSASDASATAGKLGKQLPALPSDLDGSTLTLDAGPAVLELDGSEPGLSGLGGLLGTSSKASAPPSPIDTSGTAAGTPDTASADTAGSGRSARHGLGSLLGELGLQGIPQVAIVQMKAPTLYSSGPSVSEYENALLSLPGMPADLAQEIRSLGNLSTTFPIPIPTSLASTHAADINGAPGLVIGDSTGIASGVLWVNHGMLYAVVGAMTDHQVVAIARSMH